MQRKKLSSRCAWFLSVAALLLVLAGCATNYSTTSPTSEEINTSTEPVITTTMASPPTQVITDTTTTPDRRDMSVADAHDLLERYKGNPYTVLLDVRTPQEYAAGRVAESLNVDYVAAGFRDEVNKLDRNKAYLVYCRTGIRSAAASDTMIGLGLEVYNMLGGIDAWQAAGYPVVQ